MTTPTEPTFNAPKFLIIATTLATFGFIVMVFFFTVPEGIANVLFTLIGYVVAKWQSIVDYFFGSSSGSKAKSDTINEMAGTGTGGDGTTTKSTTVTKKEEVVVVDTGKAAPAAAWTLATAYKAGDKITVGTQEYRALVDHTAAAENEPGTGATWATKWERVP